MSQGRPLLAARTSSGEKDGAGGSASPGSNRPPGPASTRAKRTLIESACSACRRRKSRCDGQRPACTRCQSLRTECHYEAEEGESRWSALRRRNQVLESERDQLRELLHFVQTRPEPEAQELFQRIRTTGWEDLFMLLRHMKEGPMNVQPQAMGTPVPMTPAVSGEQRLPPIQAILDPARGMPPAQLVHSQSISSEESRGSSDAALGSVPPGHRHPLDTLEPSLRGQQRTPAAALMPHGTLSSEESTGSISSTSMDLQNNPYFHNNNNNVYDGGQQQRRQSENNTDNFYGHPPPTN